MSRRRSPHLPAAFAVSPVGGNDRHGLMESVDEEEAAKGKKPQHHFFHYVSVSVRRFCLNPRSRLPTTMMTTSPRAPRRQSVAMALLVLLSFYMMISWLRRTRSHPLRHDSVWSLERTPIMINMFRQRSNGSEIRHLALPFLEPLKRTNRPDYNGLVFSSLKSASISDFRRRLASDDYSVNEKYRRHQMFRGGGKDKFTDIYFQNHEEVVSLECQRQNWQDLYFPNCNAFHEFDLGRGYDPRSAHEVDHLGYHDTYRIR